MAVEPLRIASLAEVKQHEGRELGSSDWVTVSQEQIQAFADLTGDHQWIHVDVERAARDSPWKGTIAHGYLTLALVPVLLNQLIVIEGSRQAVNTGVEKLRFASPVLAGSRVRLGATLAHVRELPRGGLRASFQVRLEVDGEPRPALRASVNYAYMP